MSKAFETIDSPLQQTLRDIQRQLNQSPMIDVARALRQQDSAMQETIRAFQEQIQQAPWLKAIREFQAQESSMMRTIRAYQEQVQQAPWLKALREMQGQRSQLLEVVRDIQSGMQNSPLTSLFAEVGKWQPTSLQDMTNEPLSAQGLENSPLIRYLVSDGTTPVEPQQTSVQSGLAISDSYDAEILYPTQSQFQLDQSIVEKLRNGTDAQSLPPEAKNRLVQALMLLWFLWDFMLRCAASVEAYEQLASRLEPESTPAQVRKIAKDALSDEIKEVLSGMRVVTRHNVILRTGPGTAFNELSRLPIATPLELLSEPDGPWLHVYATVNDEVLEGWIYRAYTAAIPEPKIQ